MEKTMMDEHDVQQRLVEFVGRETEYWDYWGAVRMKKTAGSYGRPAGVTPVRSLA